MLHEARRRSSVARAAYDSSSRRLLQNKHISLSRRAMLFGGLVAATYHNLELWTDKTPRGQSCDKVSKRLNRKLLACEVQGTAYYQLTPEQTFYMTQQQTLAVRATLRRLGFLCNMVQHGGKEICAIVQAEGSWATQVPPEDGLEKIYRFSTEPPGQSGGTSWQLRRGLSRPRQGELLKTSPRAKHSSMLPGFFKWTC